MQRVVTDGVDGQLPTPDPFGEEPPPTTDIPVRRFASIQLHRGGINALVLAPDRNGAYSGGDDGSVNYVEVPSGKRFQAGHEVKIQRILDGTKPVLALAVSPDGRLLAVGQTSSVVIYDLQKREIIHQLTRIQGRITALAFDPRAELVAFGLANGEIYIWSLQQGFFEGQGRDSLDAIENYTGGVSPIVNIVFHPGGGAFFAAEQDGVVSLWRLLRTESEIGLRDSWAVADSGTQSDRRRVVVNVGPTRVEDLWLNEDGSGLYISLSTGAILPVKVRGLVARDQISLGDGELFSLSGERYQGERGSGELIVTSSRGQRLQLLCGNSLENTVGGRTLDLIPIGKSALLPRPLGRLRFRSGSPTIFSVEKSDTMVIIDLRLLLKSPNVEMNLKNCYGR